LVGFYTYNVQANSFTASNSNVLNLPSAVLAAALALANANASDPSAATEEQAPYGYYLVNVNLGSTIRVSVYGPAPVVTPGRISNKTPVRRPGSHTPSAHPGGVNNPARHREGMALPLVKPSGPGSLAPLTPATPATPATPSTPAATPPVSTPANTTTATDYTPYYAAAGVAVVGTVTAWLLEAARKTARRK
jgi:hypothetical protein